MCPLRGGHELSRSTLRQIFTLSPSVPGQLIAPLVRVVPLPLPEVLMFNFNYTRRIQPDDVVIAVPLTTCRGF